MTSKELLNLEQVRAMSLAVGLELPEHRLGTLVKTFSDFLQAFEPIWDLELVDREPGVITYSPDSDQP